MKYVYIVFNSWEEYDDILDHLIDRDDLIGVFASREKAVKFIKEELIEKHDMTMIDRDLETDWEVYVTKPGDETIYNYYIVEQLIQ